MTAAPSSGMSGFAAMAVVALAAVYLPYAVKRAIVTGTPGEVYWLAWDYSIRIVSLVGIYACYRCGLIDAGGTRASMRKVVAAFILGLLFLYLLDAHVFPVLARSLPYLHLFRPPAIRNEVLLIFDLTIGLALVAVSEELAFRRVAFSALQRLGLGGKGVVLASAAIFALVHLTSGLDALLNVFLLGLMLGTVFWVTRRLSLCVILHYLHHSLGFERLIAQAGLGSGG